MLIRKSAVVVAVIAMLFAVPAFALDVTNLLALTAMPLAVAAAADTPRIQIADLTDLITRLNDANVPPVEFVQIIRSVPERPQLVEYAATETRRGVVGHALATSITNELHTRDDVSRRGHPHGGPPGQLKKLYGYKTGAEVVHGTHRHGHGRGHSRFVAPQPMFSSAPPMEREHGNPHGGPPGNPGHGKGHGKGGRG